MKNIILAAICLTCLTGCNAARQSPSPMPPVVPVQSYPEVDEPQKNPGSIFNTSNADTLFSDNRARRVGDIVTINVVESSQAKNKADTTTSKSSSNDYGVNAYFGQTSASANPFNPKGPFSGEVGAGGVFQTTSNNDLTGKGETKRENTVTATLAARVVRVMPGGVLQIEGARETRINDETQYMVVTGTIRARDIAADNSILSSQMADAHLAYYGKGVLADKQRPGWFTRLMDNAWPF